MKRIGIFQYEWPVKVYTIDLAAKLAEAGFQIDLYLYECDTTFASPAELAHHPNIRVLSYKRSLVTKILGRLTRVTREVFGLVYRRPFRMSNVVKTSLPDVTRNQYDYFIGIEKHGLVWAGMLAERLGTPYLYYSLELYVDGHPALESEPGLASIRGDERKYHARAAGTIIQDALRAKVLLESNGIGKTDVICIPVSICGKKIEETSHFLHERLGIEFSKKIILYVGKVCKQRSVNELVNCVERLGKDFVMVFHGPLYADVPTDDKHGGKVFFSGDMISNKDISKLMSSAYIGIAYYGGSNSNDRLTAFSSEKIAYYMQSGLPIIAHRNESYELLMQQHRCGELIDEISRLPEAVQKIDADHARYRENAFTAFEHFYSFDINMRSLTEYLSHH